MLSGIPTPYEVSGVRLCAALLAASFIPAVGEFNSFADEMELKKITYFLDTGVAEYKNHNYLKAEQLWQEGLNCKNSASQRDYVMVALETELGKSLKKRGSFKRAQIHLEAALAKNIVLFGSESFDSAKSRICLADLHIDMGHYSKSLELSSISCQILKNLKYESNFLMAKSLILKGNSLHLLRRDSEAEPITLAALSILRNTNANLENMLTVENNLANIYSRTGRKQIAGSMLRSCILRAKSSPEFDLKIISSFQNNLGTVCEDLREYQKAKTAYQEALKIRIHFSGADHPLTAVTLVNLAHLNKNMGDFKAAEDLYKQSLAIFRKNFGTHHPHIKTVLNSLAYVYDAQGRSMEAEKVAKESQLN